MLILHPTAIQPPQMPDFIGTQNLSNQLLWYSSGSRARLCTAAPLSPVPLFADLKKRLVKASQTAAISAHPNSFNTQPRIYSSIKSNVTASNHILATEQEDLANKRDLAKKEPSSLHMLQFLKSLANYNAKAKKTLTDCIETHCETRLIIFHQIADFYANSKMKIFAGGTKHQVGACIGASELDSAHCSLLSSLYDRPSKYPLILALREKIIIFTQNVEDEPENRRKMENSLLDEIAKHFFISPQQREDLKKLFHDRSHLNSSQKILEILEALIPKTSSIPEGSDLYNLMNTTTALPRTFNRMVDKVADQLKEQAVILLNTVSEGLMTPEEATIQLSALLTQSFSHKRTALRQEIKDIEQRFTSEISLEAINQQLQKETLENEARAIKDLFIAKLQDMAAPFALLNRLISSLRNIDIAELTSIKAIHETFSAFKQSIDFFDNKDNIEKILSLQEPASADLNQINRHIRDLYKILNTLPKDIADHAPIKKLKSLYQAWNIRGDINARLQAIKSIATCIDSFSKEASCNGLQEVFSLSLSHNYASILNAPLQTLGFWLHIAYFNNYILSNKKMEPILASSIYLVPFGNENINAFKEIYGLRKSLFDNPDIQDIHLFIKELQHLIDIDILKQPSLASTALTDLKEEFEKMKAKDPKMKDPFEILMFCNALKKKTKYAELISHLQRELAFEFTSKYNPFVSPSLYPSITAQEYTTYIKGKKQLENIRAVFKQIQEIFSEADLSDKQLAIIKKIDSIEKKKAKLKEAYEIGKCSLKEIDQFLKDAYIDLTQEFKLGFSEKEIRHLYNTSKATDVKRKLLLQAKSDLYALTTQSKEDVKRNISHIHEVIEYIELSIESSHWSKRQIEGYAWLTNTSQNSTSHIIDISLRVHPEMYTIIPQDAIPKIYANGMRATSSQDTHAVFAASDWKLHLVIDVADKVNKMVYNRNLCVLSRTGHPMLLRIDMSNHGLPNHMAPHFHTLPYNHGQFSEQENEQALNGFPYVSKEGIYFGQLTKDLKNVPGDLHPKICELIDSLSPIVKLPQSPRSGKDWENLYAIYEELSAKAIQQQQL